MKSLHLAVCWLLPLSMAIQAAESQPIVEDFRPGIIAALARISPRIPIRRPKIPPDAVSQPLFLPPSLIPVGYFRRLSPAKYVGQWTEYPVVMPGTRVEPDLRGRVLRDLQDGLPGQIKAGYADAAVLIYERDGMFHLLLTDQSGPRAHLIAKRPPDTRPLAVEDFKLE